MEFKNLIERFYSGLTEGNKRDYLTLFSDLQIQIEGWFRGELMKYFKEFGIKMTTENREVRVNIKEQKKVDLKIEINKEFHWIEIKHILVGRQKIGKFSLSFYFNSGTYIDNDINKLERVSEGVQKETKYCLVFLSSNSENKEEYEKSSGNYPEGNLKSQIDKILETKGLKNKVEVVSSAYNNDCHFGYFILKLI